MALGLAVGAGYLLGRTKKMKLAFAVGTLVAGKKLPLSPRALADLVQQQLLNNPQFKEIGDQLREDMRGVGKAATGAVLERGLDGISDRLHDRTLGVQDRLSGVIPGRVERDEPEREQEYDDEEYEEYEEERPAPKKQARKTSGSRSSAEGGKSGTARDSGTARGSRGGETSRTRKKAPAKKAASSAKSGAGTTTGAAKKTTGAAKKTTGTAKKTTGAAKTAARRTARAKGGRNDG
ncbi:DNA primase [Streptomyces sp. N35]|uniref:DNA primase n=1 Tax=Streptomyces sp. N35 TaxID=2795730 RepID=UPI0027DB1042|nr:DNA primase [Streptomyces sp. N35]